MNVKICYKAWVYINLIHFMYYLFLTVNNRVRGKFMKRNVSKKQVAFILVAVCLVGLIGIGISYSYYLANISTSNTENKNSDISSATITQVVMDMQGKVSSDGAYPGHKVVKEVIVKGIGESNSIPANASIQITPDLGDFSEDVTWKLYKSEEAITCSNKFHNDNGLIYEEGSCDIPSTASLELEGGSSSSYKNIVVNPNTETKYYLVVEYANRDDKNQSDQMSKSFSVDIGIGEKIEPPKFGETIIELAKTDTVNFATDDPDNNIRYIGKDPDNYVYFNCSDYSNQTADTCELWRIIGVFNNVSKGDGAKENLVKIIRNDSLGKFSWDYKQKGVGTSISSYGSNDWTDSQLMIMLNPTDYLKTGYTNSSDIISSGSQQLYSKMGSYYNGTKGCSPSAVASGASFSCTEVDFTSTGLKNDTTRNAIESVAWNLGGASGYNSSSNGLASHFYGYERGTKVYIERPTTWIGKIGLMYPSDYGYATGGGKNKDRAVCLDKELFNWKLLDFSDCKDNDYLYNSSLYQWTMASYSSDAFDVFGVGTSGAVGHTNASFAAGVRPALYMKFSISVDKGNGSSKEPYQLKIS